MSKSSLQRLPPAPEEALPVLTSLTKAAPSPLLQWQLLDILYSYAFVMRVYNGEYSTDALVRLIVLRLQCAAVCCSTTSNHHETCTEEVAGATQAWSLCFANSSTLFVVFFNDSACSAHAASIQ